jgi:nitrogen fixation/metabolism regulation signal transduction histidine kinase
VLVLIVGSELIGTNIDRWFNAPMDEILSSANRIASDYYHERQLLVGEHASRMARSLSTVDLTKGDVRPLRDLLAPDVTQQRVQIVEVYRVVAPGTAGACVGIRARSGAGARRRGAVDAARLTAAPPPIDWRPRRLAARRSRRSKPSAAPATSCMPRRWSAPPTANPKASSSRPTT